METIKLYVDAGNSHGLIEHKKPYTIGIFNENNGFKITESRSRLVNCAEKL